VLNTPQDAPSTSPLKDSDVNELAYTTSLISALKRERDNEIAAHQRTKRAADSRVAILEAQLAIREAELALCVPQASLDQETGEPPRVGEAVNGTSLSHSEAVAILESALSQNKLLELEVQHLSKEVRAGSSLGELKYLISIS
jgi:hypothetical protein